MNPSAAPDQKFELYSVPSFDVGRPEIVTGGEIGSSKQAVQPGDVLLCKINPRINRVWIVDERSAHPQIGSTEWIRFPKHEDVLPGFLAYYLQLERVRSHLAHNASGVGGSLMRVKGSTIANELLPLPVVDVQYRIVRRIDELFSELDDGEEELRRARAELQTYRKSLLKAAVTGELTADWRAANPPQESGADLLQRILDDRRARWEADPKNNSKRYKEPPAVNIQRLPHLPETWTWASFEQLGSVTGGLTKNAKRANLPVMLPYLRVANVGAGRLDLRRVEEIGLNLTEIERVLLQAGDLLIVEGNGSIDQIGRSAVWEGAVTPCVHQNHLIKVRFEDRVFADWAQLWLHSLHGRRELERQVSSTSGLHTLSISKVQQLPFPLPPLSEVHAAIQLAKRDISAAETATADEVGFMAASGELRQSILAAAFRGELVP